MNYSVESEIVTAVLDFTRKLQQLSHIFPAPSVAEDVAAGPRKENEAEMAQDRAAATAVTLAGQNLGASMKVEASSNNSGDHAAEKYASAVINIYINNNVQGVNNSILCDSSLAFRDPGVRFTYSAPAATPNEQEQEQEHDHGGHNAGHDESEKSVGVVSPEILSCVAVDSKSVRSAPQGEQVQEIPLPKGGQLEQEEMIYSSGSADAKQKHRDKFQRLLSKLICSTRVSE